MTTTPRPPIPVRKPARPGAVTASCGHDVPFTIRQENEQFIPEKIARIQGRACPACREIAANLADKARNAARNEALRAGTGWVKKGQEPKLLPAGTLISLRKTETDTWIGNLGAEGITVSVESAGLMGIMSKLARRWLAERGAQMRGKIL